MLKCNNNQGLPFPAYATQSWVTQNVFVFKPICKKKREEVLRNVINIIL